MKKEEADYLYEVWLRGGNPDSVPLDDIPQDFDWVYDEPLSNHLPKRIEDNHGR
jgi:hypothetical protein